MVQVLDKTLGLKDGRKVDYPDFESLYSAFRQDLQANVDEVQAMIAAGATDFTECGPGKALQGMIAKISRDVTAHGIA